MLYQIKADEVIKSWTKVEKHIRKWVDSCYEENADRAMRVVLEYIINGKMQCWASYDSEKKINYLVLTKIQTCEFSGQKSLLVFSATRLQKVSKKVTEKMWLNKIIVGMGGYARKRGCKEVVFYTDLKYLADLHKSAELISNVKYFVSYPCNQSCSQLGD